MRPEVLAAMEPWFGTVAANASSIHGPGRKAREAIEQSRSEVARAIGARPEEIVFTSGGTESDNLALRGVAHAFRESDPFRKKVAFSAAEHAAVREAALALASEGFEPLELPVDREGRVPPEEFTLLDQRVAVVSILLANNETGVIESSLAARASALRSLSIPLHTDAVQAVGKMPVRVDELGVDLLSLAGHKFGGPQGVGALFVRRGLRLRPLLFGGGQQKGRRPGTENVAAIAGLGVAVRIASESLVTEGIRLRSLRDHFESSLSAALPEIRFHAREAERLPTVSSIVFPGVSGEILLVALDLEGIAASSGSACASGTTAPSRVLLATGVAESEVRSTLRFSFGWTTTEEEISRLVEVVPHIVRRVKAASSLGVSA